MRIRWPLPRFTCFGQQDLAVRLPAVPDPGIICREIFVSPEIAWRWVKCTGSPSERIAHVTWAGKRLFADLLVPSWASRLVVGGLSGRPTDGVPISADNARLAVTSGRSSGR